MWRKKNQLIKPKSPRVAGRGRTTDGRFSGDFERDCQAMQALMANSMDMKSQTIRTADHKRIGLFFCSNLVDSQLLSREVIRPLQDMRGPLAADVIRQQVIGVPETSTTVDIVAALDEMCYGSAILVPEGQQTVVIIHIYQVEHRPIGRSESEDVIIGPHESFSEVLAKNVAIMRRLLATSKFKVQTVQIGRLSRTEVAVLYLEGVAQQNLVNEAMKRLQRLDLDHIEGAAYLIDFLSDNPLSVFPLLRVTERPHRVAAALAEGRVAIIAGGDPTALIAPTFFPEYVQSSEDYFERPLIGTFFRWLRMFSALLAVFLPGVWIALITFHHSVIPPALFSSALSGRESVPLPPVLEAVLLLLAFDIVIEASTRLPSAVGQAIGIVGAIILGQSAVQASLVSPAMTIVVALAGLATYTTPSPTMISPLRVLKYFVLAAASVFGLYGIVWAVIALALHVTALRSFGYPYLFPVAPFNGQGMLDIVARLPIYRRQRRPSFLSAENQRRMADDQRPSPGRESRHGSR